MGNQSTPDLTNIWRVGIFRLASARLAAAPNILLISAEDMGGDSIGVDG
ncbi:MAG: hypothetical protein RLZZ214_1371 [Verrucomicrobiota bacterium]|jgi:hypothetical protein